MRPGWPALRWVCSWCTTAKGPCLLVFLFAVQVILGAPAGPCPSVTVPSASRCLLRLLQRPSPHPRAAEHHRCATSRGTHSSGPSVSSSSPLRLRLLPSAATTRASHPPPPQQPQCTPDPCHHPSICCHHSSITPPPPSSTTSAHSRRLPPPFHLLPPLEHSSPQLNNLSAQQPPAARPVAVPRPPPRNGAPPGVLLNANCAAHTLPIYTLPTLATATTAGCQLPAANCRLPTSLNCTHCHLPTADCPLPSTAPTAPTAHCRLPTPLIGTHCHLPTADWPPPLTPPTAPTARTPSALPGLHLRPWDTRGMPLHRQRRLSSVDCGPPLATSHGGCPPAEAGLLLPEGAGRPPATPRLPHIRRPPSAPWWGVSHSLSLSHSPPLPNSQQPLSLPRGQRGQFPGLRGHEASEAFRGPGNALRGING